MYKAEESGISHRKNYRSENFKMNPDNHPINENPLRKMYGFQVYYENQDFNFHCWGHETVEDIKYKVYDRFKVRLHEQIINGWNQVPSSDADVLDSLGLEKTTILYLNRKNEMTQQLPSPNISYLNDSPFTSNSYFNLSSVNETNMSLENVTGLSADNAANATTLFFSDITPLNASIRFNIFYAEVYSPDVPFFTGTFADAIEEAFFKPTSTKCMFLYLHNGSSPFSSNLCDKLKDENIRDTVASYTFLGWDLEDQEYLGVLKDSVHERLSVQVALDVDNLLTRNSPALIIFGLVESEIMVINVIQDIIADSDDFCVQIAHMVNLCNEMSGNRNYFGSIQFQQHMCNSLGNRDYDRFTKHDYEEEHYLFDKIAFALFGAPQHDEDGQEYSESEKKTINALMKKVIENGDCLEMKGEINVAFLFVCCEPLEDEKKARAKKYPDYDPYTDMIPKGLFSIKRCQGSSDPCKIFIDDNGRVYKGWKKYLKRNKETKCKLILPKDGRYEADENEKVLLEEYLSNDQSMMSRVLGITDIASTGAGLGSAAVMLLTAIPAITIAPVVLTGALAVGGVVGVYSIGRSANTLVDLSEHDETMAFSNSEARGAYLNIVASSLGFVGAGATQAMSLMASRGVNIGTGARIAVNVLNGSNIALGGVNVVNQGYVIYENYRDRGQGPSSLMILQLGTSILFFGHSVYNFRLAGTIVEEAQLNTMKEINDSMRSNRHRKTFNKLTKETIRMKGDAQAGRAEVIQSISKMQNKDEVFALLTRNNKNFNREGIRFSADASTGGVKLNGVASVNIAEISSLSSTERAAFVKDLPSIPANGALMNESTGESFKFVSLIKSEFKMNSLELTMKCGKILMDCAEGANGRALVINLLREYTETVGKKLIRIVSQFIMTATEDILEPLRRSFPNIGRFPLILDRMIHYLKMIAKGYEQVYCRQRDIASRSSNFNEAEFDRMYFVRPDTVQKAMVFFERAIDMCFLPNGRIVEDILNGFMNYLSNFITMKIMSDEEESVDNNEPESPQREKVDCKVCHGYYYK